MDHKLYSWITTSIVFGIWLYIAIVGFKEYIRLTKMEGMSHFMTRKDLKQIQDPFILEAIKRWNKKIKKLFLLWVATGLAFFILSIIIEKSIGFANK